MKKLYLFTLLLFLYFFVPVLTVHAQGKIQNDSYAPPPFFRRTYCGLFLSFDTSCRKEVVQIMHDYAKANNLKKKQQAIISKGLVATDVIAEIVKGQSGISYNAYLQQTKQDGFFPATIVNTTSGVPGAQAPTGKQGEIGNTGSPGAQGIQG